MTDAPSTVTPPGETPKQPFRPSSLSTATARSVGANSDVGVLRTVLVHRPDLAHERLSPPNCHESLAEDLLWIRRAREEHDALVDTMRERGVEVLFLHDLLAETLAAPNAREWLLSRRLRPEDVTTVFSRELTDWMTAMPPEELATCLTGGVTAAELPGEMGSLVRRAMRPNDFVIAPLPNHLFTRDASAWVYGGVSLNSMCSPARQKETLDIETVYRHHPRFRDANFEIWFGGADHDWGDATLEGGDIIPVGDGVLVVGLGERSNAPAASILAQNLFAAGAARLVIGAQMPRERATMHLDTVFTFCDRDIVTIYEPVVSQILPVIYRPDGEGGVHAELSERSFIEEVQDALGLLELTVVTSGGNDVVALAPGVIVAYERNAATNSKLERAGIEVLSIPGNGRGGGRRMTCPISRDG